MKRTILYLLLTILISFNNSSFAAEFPWFNVQGFEGWVEYTTNVSADRRINVLPKLYGPSGTGEFGGASVDVSKLISVRTNGDIVLKYLILSAPSKLPFNFRQEVSRSIMQNGFRPTGFNENGLNEYQIVFPKITNIVAKIIVDGEVIREESFGSTFVSAEHTGEFLFRQNDNNYSAIYNGDFKITLDFQFPYETFSSMSLKINQATLTNIKVDVFRQVIRKAKSSGSKMWFIDTRKETIKTIEKERISTSANSSFSSNIDIILRDPDEIILKQMESFLGYQKISKDDLLLRHKELQTAAVLNGNPKLGELSANYIKALNNNDESAQIDILASLAALEKGDILTFFASGVSFKESSSSTSYTYTASIETEITMEQSEFYTTSVIKTLNYNYHAQITEFPYLLMAIQNAEDKRVVEVFGSPMPSKEQVNAALLNAVQTNNLANLKLALLKGGDPNLREHADYNTLLNICIQSNRNLLVAELLNKGANPNLKNRHGESAFTLIENSNSQEIRSLVLSYKDRSGTTNFKITLSPNFAISNVSLNLNGNVTGYVPKYSETGVWTIDGVKEYPSTYDMNAIVTIWTKVSPEMNNQFIHNNFLLAGFTAVYSQSGYTYTKQVPLYDRVKIINNGSNTYNYDLIFNPTNYSITEATGKNNNFTTSIQQSSLDGMMYNFER
jgi:hypothetical protein